MLITTLLAMCFIAGATGGDVNNHEIGQDLGVGTGTGATVLNDSFGWNAAGRPTSAVLEPNAVLIDRMGRVASHGTLTEMAAKARELVKPAP